MTTPLASSLVLKLHPTDAAKDTLRWTWKKGEATLLDAFADPVNRAVEYRLCLYDATAEPQPRMAVRIPTGGTCGTKRCWKAVPAANPKAYKFANSSASPDGIVRAQVKADTSRPGTGVITVRGKGALLPLPVFPVQAPAIVQLLVRDGATVECWEARYDEAERSDDGGFAAKGP